jgi:hypothetical protein
VTVNRDDAYVKVLSRSLDRVLDLQKFAEAKNASLLAFSSVWIAGLVNVLASGRAVPPGFHAAGIVALALFIIAAMTAIASLLPRFIHSPTEGSDGGSPNMLFFGDIAKTPVADYIAEAQRRYFPDEGCFATEALFTDLLRQIAIVSRISMRKYYLFNRAATAALLGIATFTVPVVGLIVSALQ